MNPIKFVICDLGGVYFTDGSSIAFHKIKKFIKSQDSHKDRLINELFREAPGKEGYLLRIGKLSSKEFWKIVSHKLNLNREQIFTIKEMWHSSYKPVKGMRPLIRKLRKNYEVVAFSGNTKERVKYLDEKYGLLNEFDDFVFSFEHGMNKKSPKFYKILLKIIKAKPEECVIIDDREKFLKMAKNLGMKTILFKDADNLSKKNLD